MALLALDTGATRASLAFAVLTLIVDAFVVGTLAVWLFGRVAPRAVPRPLRRTWFRSHPVATRGEPHPRGGEAVGGRVAELALWLAFAMAAVATGGSLWFSEVAGLPPCKLCWFQRICMYPLTVVCGVAALRRDRRALWTALPLAVVGACVSLYHVLLERFPSLEGGSGCDPLNPCTIVWFRRFGFVSLPFMALSGFVGIAVLVVLAARSDRAPSPITSPEQT
jgi:disulfide bond formation protein DsbB